MVGVRTWICEHCTLESLWENTQPVNLSSSIPKNSIIFVIGASLKKHSWLKNVKFDTKLHLINCFFKSSNFKHDFFYEASRFEPQQTIYNYVPCMDGSLLKNTNLALDSLWAIARWKWHSEAIHLFGCILGWGINGEGLIPNWP